MQEFASEFTGKNAHREKELFSGMNPTPQPIKPARRDDAVDMRMEHEILPPSMQDGSKAQRCAQEFLICGELLQSFRYGLKQPRIELLLILIYNGTQDVRQSEYNMEVTDIQQVVFLIVDPTFLGQRLALGAVAVTAGVVGDFNAAAAFTSVQM